MHHIPMLAAPAHGVEWLGFNSEPPITGRVAQELLSLVGLHSLPRFFRRRLEIWLVGHDYSS